MHRSVWWMMRLKPLTPMEIMEAVLGHRVRNLHAAMPSKRMSELQKANVHLYQ